MRNRGVPYRTTMISALYYLFLVLLCTFFMILSAVALVLCAPFDRSRRVVHGLSRILVRIFFAIPPFWWQRVIGLEHVDRRKSYVIVLNHNTVIDIPTLYYLPLNFRWVSKREVFRLPFFGNVAEKVLAKKIPIEGFFRSGDNIVYTTRGLGTSRIPVRFMCTPAITIAEIKSAQSRADARADD